jgi:uncharacterized protein YbbC (DUF1343 family)
MNFKIYNKISKMNKLFLWFVLLLIQVPHTISCTEKNGNTSSVPSTQEEKPSNSITTGAEQLSEYLPLLKNKNVALVVNHTAVIKNTHLVDTLLSLNIKIKKIFAPEHGFRGKADAGEKVHNEVDEKTCLRWFGSFLF